MFVLGPEAASGHERAGPQSLGARNQQHLERPYAKRSSRNVLAVLQ
jgi:hypothetical protein